LIFYTILYYNEIYYTILYNIVISAVDRTDIPLMMTIPYPFLTPDCYGMSLPLPRQYQSWQDRNPRHLDRAHVEAVFREMKAQKQQPVLNVRKDMPNRTGWREKLSRKYVFLCLGR
jgi:hypothetical protein